MLLNMLKKYGKISVSIENKGVEDMPKVEKTFNQAEYTKEFQKKNYYRLNVVLPKDYRDIIDVAVSKSGMSKNQFIKSAIDEKLASLDK